MARAEESRRANEAKDLAFQAMQASLEDTIKRLLDQEGRRSGRGADIDGDGSCRSGAASSSDIRKAEQAKVRERRMALEAASRSFRLDEMGIGSDKGGSAIHQRNRFEMIDRVFALGDPKPPAMQADWKRWLNRLDKRGVATFKRAWATRLRNEMVEVVQQLQNGITDAALRWHGQKTREWVLNGAAFVVPGAI